MKMLQCRDAAVFVLTGACLAGIAACGDGSVDAGRASATPGTDIPVNCGLDKYERGLAEEGTLGGYQDGEPYQGLPLEQARQRATAKGLTLRIVGEDGECFDMSQDANGRRVNVYVEDATVVRAVGF